MALLLSFASIITLLTAHNINYEGRIVNGQPVSASEYPWMVSLRQVVDFGWPTGVLQNQFCGGSLIEITPPIILTAAHCVDIWKHNTSDDTIRDNSGNINKLYADINRTYDLIDTSNDTYWTLNLSVSNIHIHPLWNHSLFKGYDIALIILDEFKFNESDINIDTDYYKTLLPTILTSNDYDDGTQCCDTDEVLTVIGYGDLEDEGDSSPRLLTTTLKYVDSVECGAYLVNRTILLLYNVSDPALSDAKLAESGTTRLEFESVVKELEDFVETGTNLYDDVIVCVIGDNTDLCQGDSGGPLFRFDVSNDNKPEIMGVASFVMGDCNDGYPSGYTNVADYDHWIRSTISYEAYGISFDPTPSPTNAPVETDGGYRCYGDIVNMVVILLSIYVV